MTNGLWEQWQCVCGKGKRRTLTPSQYSEVLRKWTRGPHLFLWLQVGEPRDECYLYGCSAGCSATWWKPNPDNRFRIFATGRAKGSRCYFLWRQILQQWRYRVRLNNATPIQFTNTPPTWRGFLQQRQSAPGGTSPDSKVKYVRGPPLPRLSGTHPSRSPVSPFQAEFREERHWTLNALLHRSFKNDRIVEQDISKTITCVFLFHHQTVYSLELETIVFTLYSQPFSRLFQSVWKWLEVVL